MQINLKIAKKTTTASTKQCIQAKISHGLVHSWSKYYSALTPLRITGGKDEEIVRVYNLEKRRKKVVRTRASATLKANGNRVNTRGKTQSKVISPNHWVAHYYDIPVYVLKLAKLKVVQHTRNFEFVSI